MEYANETIRFKMIKIKQTLLHNNKWEKQDLEQGLFCSNLTTFTQIMTHYWSHERGR